MTQGFWKNLRKPFFALAPMAEVTDAAFRKMVAKYGKPDVLFTEFVSSDALCHPEGRERVKIDLQFSSLEHPIVAQIFGANPEHFFRAARIIAEMGFDGIDINMGCPEKHIVQAGQCAGLMREPSQAQEIITATQEGAGGLPVSVKTRIGFDRNEVETWIPSLLEVQPAALTIHGRTKKEMSKVPCHWDAIARCVEIRNTLRSSTWIIGNGDVFSLADAYDKAQRYHVDGIMMGRAVFGNPWLFNASKTDVSVQEKLSVMVEHTQLFEEYFSNIKPFAIMRKHYKAYVNGWSGARALRAQLMLAQSGAEVEAFVKDYLQMIKRYNVV